MAYLRPFLISVIAVLALTLIPSLLTPVDAKVTFSGISKELIAAKKKILSAASRSAQTLSDSSYNPCLLLRAHGFQAHRDSVLGHPCSTRRASTFNVNSKVQRSSRQARLLFNSAPFTPGGGHHPPGVGHHPFGVGHHSKNIGHHPPGVGHHPKQGHHCNIKKYSNQCEIENAAMGFNYSFFDFVCCRKSCKNLATSHQHCGMCNFRCTERQECCAGKCVDITSDPSNCGGCSIYASGHVCPTGATCVAGVCSIYGSS